MKKRILACVLAGTMALSTASVAFAGGETPTTPAEDAATEKNAFSNKIDAVVNTDAKAATVVFSVPTTVNVALDPFQAGDKSGSQIWSNPQPIYNKSNIPIRVIVKAGVEIKKDTDNNPKANLQAQASDVTSSDITNTDKDAYVELVAEPATATTDRSGAVVISTTNLEGKDYATAYVAAGADTTAKTVLEEVAGDGSLTKQISFGLKAANYAADRGGTMSFTSFADENKGVASFRFMGSLNANAANWSKDDMAVKVVYDVNGMSAAAYDALFAANGVDAKMKAANVYSKDAVGGGSTTPPASTDPTITPNVNQVTYDSSSSSWDQNAKATITKPDSWSDIEVDSVTYTTNITTTDTTLAAGKYTFTAATGVFEIPTDGLNLIAPDNTHTSATVKINVKTSDGSKTKSLEYTFAIA